MLDSQSRIAPADECFVRVPLADAPPTAVARDVVLARCDGPVAPDALVVARQDERYALCRVARVTDDALELLPMEGAGAPLHLRRDAPDVVGTVLLRWRDVTGDAPLG
jgi:hypothetical protein